MNYALSIPLAVLAVLVMPLKNLLEDLEQLVLSNVTPIAKRY